MSLLGTITRFKTGDYTVTRAAASTYVNGRAVAGAPSTFLISASVQPVTGDMLQLMPEGQHVANTRVVFTSTVLQARNPTAPATEPDTIAIDGATWVVISAETWSNRGVTHCRAMAAKVVA